MTTIEELRNHSAQELCEMDALMHELSARSECTEEILKRATGDENCHVYVIRQDGRIVASGCLCVAHTTEQTLGFVESVVVSSSVRGQGLGRRIMEHIIQEGRRMGIRSLHLTSKPARIAANRLYQSLGFSLRETNCYAMELQD